MGRLTLAGTMFHNITADDVTFTLEALEEDIPVRGNALASGDDAEDRAAEKEIIDRLAQGDLWAWCTVKVTGRWGSFEAHEYLGCCSYLDERDFRLGAYYSDMCESVLQQLRMQIAATAEELAPLFGTEEP